MLDSQEMATAGTTLTSVGVRPTVWWWAQFSGRRASLQQTHPCRIHASPQVDNTSTPRLAHRGTSVGERACPGLAGESGRGFWRASKQKVRGRVESKQCDCDLQWIDACCGCAQSQLPEFCGQQDRAHSLEAPTPPLIAPNARLPATPGSSPAHCVYASLIPSNVDMSIAEYGNTPIKPAGKPRKKYRNRPRDHMSRAVCRIRAFPRAWPPEEDMTRVCCSDTCQFLDLDFLSTFADSP